MLAIPSSGARTSLSSGARPLSPPPRGPQPSGLVTVPLPLVASPYLTQPKVNPCLATYASSTCGSAALAARRHYPSGLRSSRPHDSRQPPRRFAAGVHANVWSGTRSLAHVSRALPVSRRHTRELPPAQRRGRREVIS